MLLVILASTSLRNQVVDVSRAEIFLTAQNSSSIGYEIWNPIRHLKPCSLFESSHFIFTAVQESYPTEYDHNPTSRSLSSSASR